MLIAHSTCIEESTMHILNSTKIMMITTKQIVKTVKKNRVAYFMMMNILEQDKDSKV